MRLRLDGAECTRQGGAVAVRVFVKEEPCRAEPCRAMRTRAMMGATPVAAYNNKKIK